MLARRVSAVLARRKRWSSTLIAVTEPPQQQQQMRRGSARLLEGKRASVRTTHADLPHQMVAGAVVDFPVVDPTLAASALRGAWKTEGAASPAAYAAAAEHADPTAGWTGALPFAPVGALVQGTIAHASWRRRELRLHPRGATVVDPGPHAITPTCAHFGACGGCAYQSTAYAAQLDSKARHVDAVFADALGPAQWAALQGAGAVRPAVGSPRAYGYRNRVSFSVGCEEWRLGGPLPRDGGAAAGGSTGGGGHLPLPRTVIGFHPSRYVTGQAGGGGGRRKGGGSPAAATDEREGGTDAAGDAAAVSTAAAGAAAPSRERYRGVSPWDKILPVSHCHLMPAGASALLRAVRDAAGAWEQSGAGDGSSLPPLYAALKEVVVKTGTFAASSGAAAGDSAPGGDGGPRDGLVYQLGLRWAEPAHVRQFEPFVRQFLQPRLAEFTAGPTTGDNTAALVSLVGLWHPDSVPRALRKEWEGEERTKLWAQQPQAALHGAGGAQVDAAALAAAVQARALAFQAGTCVTYWGATRLAKVYSVRRAPAASAGGIGGDDGGTACLRLHVSPRAFVQPSDDGAEAIMAELARVVAVAKAAKQQRQQNDAGSDIASKPSPPSSWAPSSSPFVAWDLYCGTGALGLSLAVSGIVDRVVGIELDAAAVGDATANAAVNGLPPSRAAFICADLGNPSDVARLRAGGGGGSGTEGAPAPSPASPTTEPLPPADVVVLDPPRPGLHPAMVASLRRVVKPPFIAYVSCNPASQARDVEALCGYRGSDGGPDAANASGGGDSSAAWGVGAARYRLLSVTPVDQYPHTAHVEAVALLQRVR
jgi:tRNA/tmRNA/rRNA uracil-C5-methylase (TrmA/RlmC/RlmD family)